jgi:hypothetical protein
MACERYREELADVAAGGPPRPELETHLYVCGACRAELERRGQGLALADATLAELASAEPSPALRARIRQAVAEDESARRASALWRFGLAAALTAGIVVAAFLVTTGRRIWRAPEAGPREATAEKAARESGPEQAPARHQEPVVASAKPPAGVHRPRAGAPSGDVPSASPSVERVASEPEVLVPPGGAEVLLRFAAHLRHRGVPQDSLLVADLSGPLPELRPVVVEPPLEIVPLDPAEGSGT